MNQHRVKQLRSLFVQLPTFNPTDSRFRTAWRSFKSSYNRVPRTQRAGFMAALKTQVAELKAATQPVAETAAT